jgi:sensor c-di-GMP phosphodiesterase-like protein
MDTHVERRIQIERELRRAIASNNIVPHYQPLVSLDGNRIIGFEALARWHNGDLGFVAPDVFVPVAEETGLINALGDHFFVGPVLMRARGLRLSCWPSMSRLSNCAIRHLDYDFYRSSARPDLVRAA